MAPPLVVPRSDLGSSTKDPLDYSRHDAIVEGWAQGFNVGAIVVLILILLCNYRPRVLLHKLIVVELLLAICHGFFIFFSPPAMGWILSGSAVPLYLSYNLHNVVAWLKIRPFLPRWGSNLFIYSLAAAQPYWILEAYANFAYFNVPVAGGGGAGAHPVAGAASIFRYSRYAEPLLRDPWWIFTTVKLVLVIKQNYEYTLPGLVRTSPRFGTMLLAMLMSVVFIIADVIVTIVVSTHSGINPYWRLALVFKCAADTIFLDDFKSVLDHIAESAMKRIMSLPPISSARKSGGTAGGGGGRCTGRASHVEHNSHHHAGPSVSISANRPNGTAVSTNSASNNRAHHRKTHRRGVWSGSRLTSRRRGSNDSQNDGVALVSDGMGLSAGGAGGVGIGGGSSEHMSGQIVAQTEITISESERRRQASVASTNNPARGSSSRSNTRPHDYGWGEPPGDMIGLEQQYHQQQQRDLESGIPMMPIKARTSSRMLGFGS